MPILKRKNKSAIPSKNELDMLDGSVDELSRQTEELLKGFGEKSPAKKAISHKTTPKITPASVAKKTSAPTKKTSAKSFDIIHVPSRKKLSANLKSRPHTEPKELLPSRAGLSYNETKVNDTSGDINSSGETPAIVHHHVSGALHMAAPKQAASEEPLQQTDTQNEVASQSPQEDDMPEPAAAETQSTASQPFAFEETSSEDSSVPENTEEPSELTKETTKNKNQEPPQEAADKAAPAEPTEDFYANNATRSDEPKRFTPVDDEPFATMFDTSELHDWSKLEQRQHGAWYILLLLLVIAGLIAYGILSGKSIPFIG